MNQKISTQLYGLIRLILLLLFFYSCSTTKHSKLLNNQILGKYIKYDPFGNEVLTLHSNNSFYYLINGESSSSYLDGTWDTDNDLLFIHFNKSPKKETNWSVSENKINNDSSKITLTSHGKPISFATIKYKVKNEIRDATTNFDGILEVQEEEIDTILIHVLRFETITYPVKNKKSNSFSIELGDSVKYFKSYITENINELSDTFLLRNNYLNPQYYGSFIFDSSESNYFIKMRE